MKTALLSVFIGLCYLAVGMYYSLTYNIPVFGAFVLMTSPFIMILLNIKYNDLVDYVDAFIRRFNLHIEHKVFSDSSIVYSISRNSNVPVPKMEFITKNFYEYYCGNRHIRLDKEKAESFFLDPMKPTINELTIFELCGYNDCIQTFGETYDYSKSFDELFGYYMQEGFINKIKYIIKNRDRLKTGRIR